MLRNLHTNALVVALAFVSILNTVRAGTETVEAPSASLEFPNGATASIVARKGFAYVINAWSRGNGMLAIDLRNPKALAYRGGIPPGGYPRSAVYHKGYLYIPTWFSLQVVDVRNPGTFKLLRSILFDFSTRSSCVKQGVVCGDKLYLSGATGLRIMDLSSPDAPALTAAFPEFGDLQEVQVSGDFAFLRNRNGIRIIRLNKDGYEEGGEIKQKGIKKMIAVGNALYLLTTRNQLQVYAIDQAGRAARKKALDNITMAKKSGEKRISTITKDGKLVVLELSEPLMPKAVKEVQLPADMVCSDVDFMGDVMVNLDSAGSRVSTIDITSPKARILDQVPILSSEGAMVLYKNSIIVSYARGNNLWVSFFANNAASGFPCVANLDLAIPKGRFYRKFDVSPASAITQVKGYLLVGNGVVDIKAGKEPKVVKPMTEPAAMIQIQGNYAYLAIRNRLVIEDISMLPALKTVGEYRTKVEKRTITDLALSGTFAFVLAGKTLEVVDVRSPKKPALVSQLDIPHAVSCTLSGKYLYIPSFGTSSDGKVMTIVDVSNPGKPTIVKKVPHLIANRCGLIRKYGDRLYFDDNPHGIKALDVSDPLNPKLIVTYAGRPNQLNAYTDFAVSGGTLFGRRYSGVDMWEINNRKADKK